MKPEQLTYLLRQACLVPLTTSFGLGLSVGVIVVLLATSLLLMLLTLLSDDKADVFTTPAVVLMMTFRFSASGWTAGGVDAVTT
jgi:predicted RND superfamily exporter protein